MKHEEKVALWHRLRDDPDFRPEWLKAMGQQPPAPPETRHRAWGDGVGDRREHVIADISFRDRPMWVVCRCGERIEASSNAGLEDRWSLHRGLSPETVASHRLTKPVEPMATGAEVTAFLGRASDPGYVYEADE